MNINTPPNAWRNIPLNFKMLINDIFRGAFVVARVVVGNHYPNQTNMKNRWLFKKNYNNENYKNENKKYIDT